MLDFLKLKRGLDSVAGAIKELQGAIEAKRAEYEHLAALPISRAEVLEILNSYIDAEAGRFPGHLANELKNRVGDEGDINRLRSGAQSTGIVLARRHIEVAPSPNDVQTCLLYLLNDQIKASLAKAVREMGWAEKCAPPRAERQRQLEKLDKEIQKLEAKRRL
jgi:hypothetical protein